MKENISKLRHSFVNLNSILFSPYIHINMKKNLFSLLVVLLVVGFSGCSFLDFGKIKTDEYAPEIAVPLINANFTVQDILNNFETGGYVGVGNDGIIRLVYQGKVLQLTGDSLFSLPNVPPTDIPLISGGPSVEVPFPSANGEKLNEIRFKSGTMKLKFKNPSSTETVQVSITLADFTKNGQALSVNKTLTPNQTLTENVSLAGYKVLFNNGKFNLAYSVSANLPFTQQVTFTFELQQPKYAYVSGNFKQMGFNFPLDSVSLDMFRNLKAGNIQFTDPRVTFNFQNSYGLPLRISANKLDALTQLAGWTTFSAPIYFNSVTGHHEFNFAYPTINEIGQSKSSTFYLNNTNSNIGAVISNLPYRVKYDLSVMSNPDDLTDDFFITDTSRLAIDVKVELPFTGKAKESVLRDTFDVSFDAFKMLKTAGFKTVIENSFPLSGNLQLYFYDKGILLDSMYVNSTSIFTAAEVNATGQVSTPTKTSNEAYFDAVRFAKVKTASKIILKATMSSLQNGTKEVSIFNTSGLSVKLGVISSASLAELVK